MVVKENDPELTDLVDRIAQCESSGDPTIEIVDTNGYYSRGVLQWQMRTFEVALKDLGYPVGDHATLRAQMLDGEFAKKIAYEWINADSGNVYHWSCYKLI